MNMNISSEPREFPNAIQAWSYLKQKGAAIKAQDRREKFAKDIELIRSRKQNEAMTIAPVPSDQQEGYFAKLESNGVWKQVFQSVTNLSDIISAYFADGIFRDELEENRTSMLLPEVFGVLQNLNICDEHYASLLLGRIDVLNLRLVSKTWNQAANAQFLEPVGFSSPDWHLCKDSFTNMRMIGHANICDFTSAAEVELAICAMRTSRSCSTLLKCLIIEPQMNSVSRNGKEHFLSKLVQLLDVHGQHVWSLIFGGPLDYKFLWELVSRMPNLKELTIGCRESQGGFFNENNERMLVTQFPFPAIPSLTRLLVDQELRNKIWFPEIVRRNPNLKTVVIIVDDASSLGEFYRALANLRLECLDLSLEDEERLRLNDIRPLERMNWPLKIFSLSWSDGSGVSRGVDSCALFKILNQFNNTLEKIHMRPIVPADYGQKVVVHFPKLKTVDVEWVKVSFKE